MANKKLKEKKKKDREREVRAKTLSRRSSLRSSKKQEELVFLEEKKIKAEVAKNQAVMDQINKNMQILEALEQEYDEEQRVRTEINQKLENEGFMSMKEKMDALHEKAVQIAAEKEKLGESN